LTSYPLIFGLFKLWKSGRHPVLEFTEALLGEVLEVDGERLWQVPRVLRFVLTLQRFLAHGPEVEQQGLKPFKEVYGEEVNTFGWGFLDKVGLGVNWWARVETQPVPRLDEAEFETTMHQSDAMKFLHQIMRGIFTTPEFMENDRMFDRLCSTKAKLAKSERTFGIACHAAAERDMVVALGGHKELSLVRWVGGHYVYVGPCSFPYLQKGAKEIFSRRPRTPNVFQFH
jgi:hypothetical protein